MAVVTLSEPSAEEQQVHLYNTRMKKSNRTTLATDQKYAAVLLSLHPSVTQGDYGTLKTAIEAITGILDAELLIDGQTPATIPSGKQITMIAEVHLRLDNEEI